MGIGERRLWFTPQGSGVNIFLYIMLITKDTDKGQEELNEEFHVIGTE